jgi:hypothetical protein
MRKYFLYLLFTAILIGGCASENDATTIAIYAQPSTYITKSGDKIYIDINISTINNILTNVSISTFDSEHGKTDIHNSNPGTKTFKERILWEIPVMSSDTTIVELHINATDDTNSENEFKQKIKVIGDNKTLLPERSGFTIYSPHSGKSDAFSFVTLQPMLSSSNAEDCDLIFITSDSGEYMPLKWGTKTNVIFCKANSFDYASANWTSIQAVFTNSIRSDYVDNLQIDDIILIGREERTEERLSLKTIGAIKIMGIYDEEGYNNDRIVFNIKTLP